MSCKFCDEFTGVCCNDKCPMCADCCPVPDVEGVCQFEDREEESYTLTPKGCASIALRDAGLVPSSEDPAVDVFWNSFHSLMLKFGYAAEGA